MNQDENIYLLALQLINGIGPSTLRKLVEYSGSAKAVFENIKTIKKEFPKLALKLKEATSQNSFITKAEEEVNFCRAHNIKIINFNDKNYPQRLKQCKDAPAILFYQGNIDLNYRKIISIVGTRNSTAYGKSLVEKLIEELADHKHQVLIVSGLAYGIDITAHKSAMQNKLPTVAILGNGSDSIYPSAHRQHAKTMLNNGGIITEFPKGTKPERGNFVSRNRIIAGICDALIVIESGIKGGSLISADMAFSYNRDVFAFPGKVGDPYSEGCNKLIKSQKAALIESASDLEYIMNWAPETGTNQPIQTSLFEGLNNQERTILELILQDGNVTIDYLASKLGIPINRLSGVLLNMEFKNIVKSLPGNQYTKAL